MPKCGDKLDPLRFRRAQNFTSNSMLAISFSVFLSKRKIEKFPIWFSERERVSARQGLSLLFRRRRLHLSF